MGRVVRVRVSKEEVYSDTFLSHTKWRVDNQAKRRNRIGEVPIGILQRYMGVENETCQYSPIVSNKTRRQKRRLPAYYITGNSSQTQYARLAWKRPESPRSMLLPNGGKHAGRKHVRDSGIETGILFTHQSTARQRREKQTNAHKVEAVWEARADTVRQRGGGGVRACVHTCAQQTRRSVYLRVPTHSCGSAASEGGGQGQTSEHTRCQCDSMLKDGERASMQT